MREVSSFYLQMNGESESMIYELTMLAREFWPQAQISSQPAQMNLIFEDGCWKLFSDPDMTVMEEREAFSESQVLLPSGSLRKNDLKRALYRLLSRWCGQKLPWGILTGVRPTKLVYQALDQKLEPEVIGRRLQTEYALREDKADLALRVACREKQLLEDHTPYDLAVYVGIPFCPTRCSYCSFVSYDFHALGTLMEEYTGALIHEIRAGKAFTGGRRLQSFYMGGGTPTTLSPDQLFRVLSAVDETFGLSSFREVTVEAGRPDTITAEKLQVLRDFKISRISVNPQTMNDETLLRIGRAHSCADTVRAFELAREKGFDNINMDLIMGLPGEGREQIRRTLDQIEALRPDSLTVHTLAIKRSSRLHLEEDYAAVHSMAEMDEAVHQGALTAARLGLDPYYMYRQKNMTGNFENVGYAQFGKECYYNIEMMEERQSILAFGAAAVSKVYTPAENRIERVANVKNVSEYIRRVDEMIERKHKGMQH